MNRAKKPRQKLDLTKVYEKVLEMFLQKHPDRLTFSQISRASGVARPTLYYYFGNSVKNLLTEAVRHGMQVFTQVYRQTDRKKHPDWESLQRTRLKRALKLVRKYPWAPSIYFRYRNSVGEWGKYVRDVELQYCEQIAKDWEYYHGKQPPQEAVHLTSYFKLGLMWGVVTEQDLWADKKEEDWDELVDRLTSMVTDLMRGRG